MTTIIIAFLCMAVSVFGLIAFARYSYHRGRNAERIRRRILGY